MYMDVNRRPTTRFFEMAIDKLNSLQFLCFMQRPYFEEFGEEDGVYVDRVPFELRIRLLRWT